VMPFRRNACARASSVLRLPLGLTAAITADRFAVVQISIRAFLRRRGTCRRTKIAERGRARVTHVLRVAFVGQKCAGTKDDLCLYDTNKIFSRSRYGTNFPSHFQPTPPGGIFGGLVT